MKTDQENKRQTILAIATGIFAKFGFDKTTLDDIADAVGMKKGSLYYYFDSKEAIFSAVIHEVAQRLFLIMKEKAEEASSARDAVLRFVETGIRSAQDATNVIGISAQVKLELLPLADQMMKDFHDELLGYLATIIKRGIETGEFRSCDAQRISDSIHSVIQGIQWNALYRSTVHVKQEFDIAEVVEQAHILINLILDGLAPSQPTLSTSS